MMRRKEVFKPYTGKGGRAVFVYHLDDVNKAVAWAKQQMPPETQVPSGWRTARELAADLGVTVGKREREPIILSIVLKLGREAKEIDCVRIRKERGKLSLGRAGSTIRNPFANSWRTHNQRHRLRSGGPVSPTPILTAVGRERQGKDRCVHS